MLRTLEFVILVVSAIVFFGLVFARPEHRFDDSPEEHVPIGANEIKAK
jgi:hypothetical protein